MTDNYCYFRVPVRVVGFGTFEIALTAICQCPCEMVSNIHLQVTTFVRGVLISVSLRVSLISGVSLFQEFPYFSSVLISGVLLFQGCLIPGESLFQESP